MHIIKIGTLLMCCIGLSACETTSESRVDWEIEGGCSEANGCEIKGKMKGSFGGGEPEAQSLRAYAADSPLLANAMLAATQVPDAALFAINTGGTVGYPITGQVIIKLKNSSSGIVEAVDVFSWVRSGSVITLSDPDAVNAWAIAEGGSADTLDYNLVPWTPPFVPGEVSMAVQAKYENQVKAFHFVSYCYTTTGELQTHDTCLQ